jgi:negative regulator of flagellin synthesis FlgM
MDILTNFDKLNPYTKNKVQESSTTQNNQAQKGESAEQQSDKVELSSKAQELNRITKAVEESSDVRAERVAELKAKVAQGEYKPDSRETAANMLREDMNMFGIV